VASLLIPTSSDKQGIPMTQDLTLSRVAVVTGGARGIGLAIGHVVAGTVWTLFHILVITLQAFIFMMLTLIYVGQAHDAH